MFPSSKEFDLNIRESLLADIPAMALHHRKMFEEIWVHKGETLNPERGSEVEKAYGQKLEIELRSGVCKAWVIEDKKKIIASGAITLVSFVPNPSDLTTKVAYIHSVYTEQSHRNKKCAQMIIKKMINYCKYNKINRVILNASSEGQRVYEKFGFQKADDAMRLFIK